MAKGRSATVRRCREPDEQRRASPAIVRDAADQSGSEAFLSSLLDLTSDGIVCTDEAGNITSVNRPAEIAFGYAEGELLGSNLRILIPAASAEQQRRGLAADPRAGRAKAPVAGREIRGRRRDGSVFPLELTVSEFQFAGRRHFFGLLRDLTARRRLEQQLLNAQKMEPIGELASGIAHDFNNVLMVIQNHCHVLLSGMPAGDRRRQSIEEISQAGEHAASLIRQLLGLSRHHTPALVETDLHEVVANVASMLRMLVGNEIEIAIASSATHRRVRINSGLMEQLLLNLVGNARDAMPRGGRVAIETRDLDPDEDCCFREPGGTDMRAGVLLSVSDTGCGMDPETKSHIFDPFFTTKSADKGTGLGLAMVRDIVRQFGGSIQVDSEPGHGSRFRICLPASEGEPAPAGLRHPAGRGRARTPRRSRAGSAR